MACSPEPKRSWRVTLLPFLFEGRNNPGELYNEDQPWDSPINAPLQKLEVPAYTCPSNPFSTDEEGRWFSAYAAVSGKGTVFPELTTRNYRDIPDGLSHTLMVVEACGQQIIWTEPRDIDPEFDALTINEPGERKGASSSFSSSFHAGGSQVMLADGSVRFMSENTDPEILRSLLISDDGRPSDNW